MGTQLHLNNIANWTLGVGLEIYQDRTVQLAGAENKSNANLIEPVNDYTFGNTATSLIGTISADSELFPGTKSWNAYWPFNSEITPISTGGINNFGWLGGVDNVGWLRNTLTTGIVVNKVTIESINDGNRIRSPIDFTIRGSNDNFVSDDNILHTVTGGADWSQKEKRTYLFTNYTRYTSYEIRISLSQRPDLEPGIGKLEFMTLPNTGSPVAETGVMEVDGTLDAVEPVRIDSEVTGTGSNLYQYSINGGAYNGVYLTLTAMNAALAGLNIDTIQFKAQFNAGISDNVRLHNSPSYVEIDSTPPINPVIKGPIKVIKLDTGIKVIKI